MAPPLPPVHSILMQPILSDAQKACVELLEEALEEAKRGTIHAIAIIACMEGGFASVMAGTKAGDLNLGCDELKRKILDAVTGGHIVKPGTQSHRIMKVRS